MAAVILPLTVDACAMIGNVAPAIESNTATITTIEIRMEKRSVSSPYLHVHTLFHENRAITRLFHVLVLKVNARKDTYRREADEENDERRYIVGIHLSDPQ